MRTKRSLLTAEELLMLSAPGRRYELVKGELYEMPPAGANHGNIAMTIGALIHAHVRSRSLGYVFAAETGFILRRDPDTVRAPDAAFVSRDRIPEGEMPAGFLELAPDLVVEVLSPGDRAREVREKVRDWLAVGTRLVWLIRPGDLSVEVLAPSQPTRLLGIADDLEGGDVLPGFRCSVEELLA